MRAHPLLAVVCLACGVAWAWANGVDAAHELASRGWPTAPGRVVTSEVTQSPIVNVGGRFPPRRGTIAEFHLRYSYVVGGTDLEGERVSFRPNAARREPHRDLARYPAGASVTVHYDPETPMSAVLETDVPFALLGQTALGLAVALVGAVTLRRGMRRVSPFASPRRM